MQWNLKKIKYQYNIISNYGIQKKNIYIILYKIKKYNIIKYYI